MTRIEDDSPIPALPVDEQAVAIITHLQDVWMERRIPLAEQAVLKGADYRVAHLVATLTLALLVIGGFLIMLLGPRHPVTNALVLGFAGALACLFLGAVIFYAYRQTKARRAKDPLSAANLSLRIEYERDCVQSVLKLRPTDQGLERAALEIEAQMDRYTSHGGARNDFFRNYKDLVLAALLLFGVTPENAVGELSRLIVTATWAGAVLLIISFFAGMALSAKASRFKFWLSVIALARFQMRQAATD